jgi:hypothetical protein
MKTLFIDLYSNGQILRTSFGKNGKLSQWKKHILRTYPTHILGTSQGEPMGTI